MLRVFHPCTSTMSVYITFSSTVTSFSLCKHPSFNSYTSWAKVGCVNRNSSRNLRGCPRIISATRSGPRSLDSRTHVWWNCSPSSSSSSHKSRFEAILSKTDSYIFFPSHSQGSWLTCCWKVSVSAAVAPIWSGERMLFKSCSVFYNDEHFNIERERVKRTALNSHFHKWTALEWDIPLIS